MRLLLGISLIYQICTGNANPSHADSDTSFKSPILVTNFYDPIGTIDSSQLQLNRTYDFFIKGYPDEEHLLVLDFSNVGKNKFKIFGDRVNNKKSSCLAYNLKGSKDCRNVWIERFKTCPLQTMASQDIRMTLKTKDLSGTSLITYKTVNCTTGVPATQKTAVPDCGQPSKVASSGFSTLEFILMIALAFSTSLALIFAAILLRIQCQTRRNTENPSDDDFVYKQSSDLPGEDPVLVDNVLYASIDREATKL